MSSESDMRPVGIMWFLFFVAIFLILIFSGVPIESAASITMFVMSFILAVLVILAYRE